MANRTLLCVDPDDSAVAAIRAALEPYGFQVHSQPNGEQAVEWARKQTPGLVIVCVEPRKVGYAICNKIKRSQELKDVPVILTSAEETLQTFEQHKKLKSRANEYLLKPLDRGELITKVNELLGTGEALPVNSDEILLNADFSDEIAIGEGDIEEEKQPPAPAPPPVAAVARPQSPFGSGPELDDIFDQETDAAFAAIQTPDGESTGPMPFAPGAFAPGITPPTPAPPADVGWEDESTRATPVRGDVSLESGPIPGMAAFAHEVPTAAAKPSALLFRDDVPPSPDEVHGPTDYAHTPPPVLAGSSADGRRLIELEVKLHESEAERERLLSEMDELKSRLQAQPLSKEKDILNLREVINRKEKDLLDLRDSVDAKDRQILDSKDRIREHERARRDLEEKSLGFEKSLMSANERVVALAHDKDKSIEREKGLKARLDDALTEIQKAHDEADGLKKRLVQTEEKARADQDRIRGELESRVAELEESHRLAVIKLNDERTSSELGKQKEFEAEILRLKDVHAGEIESLERKSSDEYANLNDRLQGEIARLRREQEKALAALKEEQAQQLAAERQAQQAASDAKEKDHKNEILGLRRRQEEELTAAEDRRQRELAEAETRREAELEGAEGRRRVELQQRDDDHQTQVAEMDRRHFTEKTELSERHRGEMDQAHARAARSEGDLAARTEELSTAYRKLGSLESDLDTARADIRERDVRMNQARDKIAELESKTAEYEDQILRAYQKLRADDKTVEKAKRALAVALSLLDERGASPAPAGGPTAKSGGPEAGSPEGGSQEGAP